MPPITTVWPLFTSTWVVICGVDRGHLLASAADDNLADAVLVDVQVMMMRLSGVICGLTLSDSVAFLN